MADVAAATAASHEAAGAGPLKGLPWDASIPRLRADLLARYLAFTGAPTAPPSVEALAELQHAHLLAIPFETISPLCDEPVVLEQDAIADKLLSGRRGGYCFEHNLLLGSALVALGYDVDILAGRILFAADAAGTPPRPRTHATVRVRLGGAEWLADVGFGRASFRGPIDLRSREPQRVAGYDFRIGAFADGQLRVDSGNGAGEWEPLYVLDPRPVQWIDCEQLNLWVSTDDRSLVRQQLIVLKTMPEGRRAIRGGRLMISEPDRKIDRELHVDEIDDVLREEFGLELPAPLTDLVRPTA